MFIEVIIALSNKLKSRIKINGVTFKLSDQQLRLKAQ